MKIIKTTRRTKELRVKIADGYEDTILVENLELSKDRWYFMDHHIEKISQRFMTEEDAILHLQNSDTLADLFNG